MLRVTICALATATIFSMAPSLARADGPTFQLYAWPLKQVIKHSGKALVHIDLKNTGTATVRRCFENASPGHAEVDLDMHIHDSAGNKPRLTEEGEEFFHPDHSKGIYHNHSGKCHSFEPQQTAPEFISLGSILVLEQGRTYDVSFTEHPDNLAVNTPLSSSWVTVTVK